MSSCPPVDAGRLWADLMALACLTDPARPFTRRSFSPLFLEGRAWLAQRFEAAGLATRIDAAGNLIGRLEGSDERSPVIAVGSHSDTVPAGGRFDGIAGVLTGLEIVRALRDADVRLHHALEIVDFLAEEPSEFGISCIGSRGMCGELTAPMLALPGPGGETLAAALRRVGGDPDRLERARRDDIVAFFELHIEQGRVLEERQIDVGFVTSIAGIRRIEVVFEGRPDHAGTTPMSLRQDALVAAAATITSVRSVADELAALDKDGARHFVATVGMVTAEPNAANVVPGRVRLVIDARSTVAETTSQFTERLERESANQANVAKVTRSTFAILSDGSPAACDPRLRAGLRHAATDLGISGMDLASGAGHDAAFMSRICPVAMIFVPSRDGRSHAPEEWTEEAALAAGAAVLAGALLDLDQAGSA